MSYVEHAGNVQDGNGAKKKERHRSTGGRGGGKSMSVRCDEIKNDMVFGEGGGQAAGQSK